MRGAPHLTHTSDLGAEEVSDASEDHQLEAPVVHRCGAGHVGARRWRPVQAEV